MRKAYSTYQKAEAVELARVLGSNTAAAQLGIDQRTIRGWMANSSDPDALDVTSGEFEQIRALAVARAKTMLASGKMTLAQVMTAAGIAEDKIAKAAARSARVPEQESAVAALDVLCDWSVDSGHVANDADLDGFDALQRELIRRANAERPYQDHRRAVLAWFSQRPEIPAGEVLDWAKAQTLAVVTEHGSLAALRAWDVQRQADNRQAMLHRLELNKVAAEAAKRAAFDAETHDLLAGAEGWLAAHAESPS